MSLAAALSSAASGLVAVARGTDVVAGNVANASTPGYARREATQTALPDGGVRIASVGRIVSAALLGDSRAAGASVGYSKALSGFYTALEDATGVPGSGTALSDRVSDAEAALIAAAARPDSEVRLGGVTSALRNLVDGVNAAASTLQAARTDADRGIADDVTRLHAGLEDVARLNRSIISTTASGSDASALMDERQRAIDAIADIVPVREVTRENGRVALFTTGGAPLLDGTKPIELTFTPAGAITPQMAVGTAPVSRLMLNGTEVTDSLMDMFAGGSLEARFAIRDTLAPQAQTSLDAFALDLVQRFADPAVDPTLAAGQAGLFTDTSGTVVERGLANRLTLNSGLAADGSGDWRLRDGLGAAAPGDVGRSTLLTALADRFAKPQAAGSTAVSTGARSVAGFAAEIAAQVSTRRVAADNGLGRDTARADAVKSDLLTDGVDTDAEMQRLLQLQQAYAANAKVISAADAMISRILEL